MQYQRVHIIIACTGKVGDHTTLFWKVRNFRTILYLTLSFLGMRLLNCCVCVCLFSCVECRLGVKGGFGKEFFLCHTADMGVTSDPLHIPQALLCVSLPVGQSLSSPLP